MEICIFQLRRLLDPSVIFKLVQYRLFVWLILSILWNINIVHLIFFCEGEVGDDERPREASASTKEPMAPGE